MPMIVPAGLRRGAAALCSHRDTTRVRGGEVGDPAGHRLPAERPGELAFVAARRTSFGLRPGDADGQRLERRQRVVRSEPEEPAAGGVRPLEAPRRVADQDRVRDLGEDQLELRALVLGGAIRAGVLERDAEVASDEIDDRKHVSGRALAPEDDHGPDDPLAAADRRHGEPACPDSRRASRSSRGRLTAYGKVCRWPDSRALVSAAKWPGGTLNGRTSVRAADIPAVALRVTSPAAPTR